MTAWAPMRKSNVRSSVLIYSGTMPKAVDRTTDAFLRSDARHKESAMRVFLGCLFTLTCLSVSVLILHVFGAYNSGMPFWIVSTIPVMVTLVAVGAAVALFN